MERIMLNIKLEIKILIEKINMIKSYSHSTSELKPLRKKLRDLKIIYKSQKEKYEK